jgi:gliding motility-associated-like protein
VVDANYTVTIQTADFEIRKAELTVTADAGQYKVYGDAEPTLTYSIDGLVNGDTEANIDNLSIARVPGEDVGNYTITPAAADANYIVTIQSSEFEITKADLIVSADDQSKVVGAEMPSLTISYDGFVNGDTAADLDQTPLASTTATKDSSVGDYLIELSSGADGNYNIEIIEGILSITADMDGNLVSIQKSYGISPNGDGNNDTWSIEDLEKYPNNVARIYNRSGKLLYEMKGYNNTFDGFSNKTNSSRKLPVGVYYYVLDLGIAGAPPIKGWMYINY